MRTKGLIVAAALSVLAACQSEPTPPAGKESGEAMLSVSVSDPATAAAVDRVTVTATGLDTVDSVLVVENLALHNGKWQGHFSSLPVGSYRFDAVAYGGDAPLFADGAVAAVETRRTTTVNLLLQQVPAPVTHQNFAPVIAAVALGDTRTDPGGPIFVAVTARDPEGRPLAYEWSASPSGSFGNSAAASTYFLASTEGEHTLTIRVTDEAGAFASWSMGLAVSAAYGRGNASVYVAFNSHPNIWNIRVTDGDAQLSPGESAQLEVQASDGDGDVLAYQWSNDCGGTFAGANGATPVFTAPAAPATCTLTVDATDGRGGAVTGWLVVEVADPAFRTWPRITYAYQTARNAAPGDTVILRLYAEDEGGGPVAYAWSTNVHSVATVTDSQPGLPGVGTEARLTVPDACTTGAAFSATAWATSPTYGTTRGYTFQVYCAAGGALVRTVLTWGANPADLDSHFASANGTHSFYGRRGSLTGAPYIYLDVDDTTGYGPEVITVMPAVEAGIYRYCVHHFRGTGTLATSNAVVEVFSDPFQRVYQVPTSPDPGARALWRVYEVTIGADDSLSFRDLNDFVPESQFPATTDPLVDACMM